MLYSVRDLREPNLPRKLLSTFKKKKKKRLVGILHEGIMKENAVKYPVGKQLGTL